MPFCCEIHSICVFSSAGCLATAKNSAVNAVFPVWPIVELPNLFPIYVSQTLNGVQM